MKKLQGARRQVRAQLVLTIPPFAGASKVPRLCRATVSVGDPSEGTSFVFRGPQREPCSLATGAPGDLGSLREVTCTYNALCGCRTLEGILLLGLQLHPPSSALGEERSAK